MVKSLTSDEIEETKVHFETTKTQHKVVISVRCKDLPDLDLVDGDSDPYAILFIKAEND